MSEAQFKKAAAIIKDMPKGGPIQPSTADQLFFYKYFKQGSAGDNTTSRPGMFDLTGKAKWDAWKSVAGTSKEEAYKQYVDRLLEILNNASDEQSKKYIEEIENA